MDLSVDELNILATALETHGIKTETEAMLYSRLCLALHRQRPVTTVSLVNIALHQQAVSELEDDRKDVQEERDYGWSR